MGRFCPSHGSRVMRVSSAASQSLSKSSVRVPRAGSTSIQREPSALRHSYQNRSPASIHCGFTEVE
jgi:hypothetical protein